MNKLQILIFSLIFLATACYKGPEDLPKLKKNFKAQISGFETQKDKTHKKIEEGIANLGTIQEALESAQNTDSEFKRVYSQWNKVDNNVKDLKSEYEKLRDDAENLFSAMERQTEGLTDVTMKGELRTALAKSRNDYQLTLTKTETAIGKLDKLYAEAIDIVKGVEVAVAIGQIAQITDGLKSIQNRIPAIMDELNNTIEQSKILYDDKMKTSGNEV